MKKSVVILCGGGPAPGINTVIASITKIFIKNNYRVIGIHKGYHGLFNKDREIQELNYDFADSIYTKGGSALKMSRYKPKDKEFTTDFFIHENVKLLITIGGDDTASTANRIIKFLNQNKIEISNIHVPKTIDNDLPLPKGIPTFGFYSAKNEGVKITKTVYEDAKTSQNWFLLSCMGREAGHLAFEIGTACHLPMIIVPEIFYNTQISAEKITKIIISSIIKRKILGLNFGATIISEGVFHFMSQDEIKTAGVNFTYDVHGHPELFNISKSHVFNTLLQKELKTLKLNIGSRPIEMGFELRCSQPIGYDLTYCTLLGIGVYDLFLQKKTACMISVDNQGNISPLYLKDIEDKNGKIKPRLLDVHSPKVQTIYKNNLHYLVKEDIKQAKKYIAQPENYLFNKILNWN